ncbi:MAG TPA: ABC transporter substrate-binding protein [Trebonia sp.]|jgi:branched-chain amino acid transport system substrate-binding protein|nr:ABC transporter substrate-binding protein [Trebonia sp.]
MAAAAALLTAAVTACSSGGSPASGGTTAAASTIKLGLIADLTGPFSSSFTTSEKGIEAYVDMVNAAGGINGHKLSYVVADSTSTITGAQTAAQELVQRDGVFAVVDDSAAFSGAETYLLQQGIPAVGGGFDGPEWNDPKNTNMFASTGVIDYNSVNASVGKFMKTQGVTVCGAVGYPNATAGPSAVAVVKSCVADGLKDGYLNTQVPVGSTDVGAIALAIQKAGVNGIVLPVVISTGFALLGALKQLGVKLKVAMLSTGYGGDLLASSAAVQAGQGYMFSSVGQPIEANTAATQKMAAALAKVGVTSSPTFAEQESYIATAAIAAGLKAAGANVTQKSFMTALRNIHNFNADGLLSPGEVNFSSYSSVAGGAGAAGCIFAATLEGKKFIPVSGTPLCGQAIPGLTTGAASS